MYDGYIKLHRRILDWDCYSDANTFRLFLHCLLNANWKDGVFKGVKIPRGNLVTSLPKLSQELRLTERQIRTAIEHLKTSGTIAVTTYSKFRIITVLNYEQYQDSDSQNDSQNDTQKVIQMTDKMSGNVSGMCQASDRQTTTIEELKKEINRVSKDTEFNTKSLLDGSIQRRVYGTNATRMAVSSNVTAADYTVTINQAAETAKKDADTVAFNDMTATIGASGKMKINSSSVEIEATDTYEQVFEKIRTAGELGETTVKADGGKLSFESTAYGETGKVEITISDAALAAQLGFNSMTPAVSYGTNAEVDIHAAGSGFSTTATAAVDGNKVTITDRDGFEMSFLTKSGLAAGSTVKLEVTDIGTMDLQVGANENQTIKVDIPEIDTETLYLDDLDVTTVTGADRAIVALDNALARVSSVRSAIGACENRLDSTVGSLDETSEDMTSALSRISDVDMAEEMTNYTQQNVLSQAAISVLSQANDIPQQVLQLLQ